MIDKPGLEEASTEAHTRSRRTPVSAEPAADSGAVGGANGGSTKKSGTTRKAPARKSATKRKSAAAKPASTTPRATRTRKTKQEGDGDSTKAEARGSNPAESPSPPRNEPSTHSAHSADAKVASSPAPDTSTSKADRSVDEGPRGESNDSPGHASTPVRTPGPREQPAYGQRDTPSDPSARGPESGAPSAPTHQGKSGPGGKHHHQYQHPLSKKAERRKYWKEKKKKKQHQHYQQQQEQLLGPPLHGAGLLEISGKGFGFLRQRTLNFKPAPNDTFVTPEMVRTYGLRDGVWIEGETREGHRGPQLTVLEKINDKPPEKYRNLPIFEELTAVNPNKRIILETDRTRYTTRIIDMMAPVGRGQRGLIVAPPRTGKTTLLQHMAEAVLKNHEGMKLILMLIDERPEEVTELTRALPGAEIFASSNDSDVKNHTRIAQLAIERAKRLVEAGEHVFILLDSITRLARAFNNAIRGGGRTMSGGYDIRAFEIPRRLFAAARNTREAGSLTIVATALIETGNKGDELVFQEFKGTGNMELVLDRAIAQQYIFPAVNIFKSGTRREELLLPPHQLEKIYVIRRGLSGHKPVEAMERLLSFCERFPSNAQMLLEIPAHA